jgi:hypothetical protein
MRRAVGTSGVEWQEKMKVDPPAVEECYGGEAGVQSASGEGTHDALEGLVVQDIVGPVGDLQPLYGESSAVLRHETL